ncbi:hypothetical protein [Parapedobacter koreensis]|uniref:Uncharacterized protein n=1 Tax=Parapedobacter koreensis TaxID=332977 RepID=A0A1H7QSZ0_9SPHI|nr:hypothetical protein [Parapedobacter koreensis]SEL51110.1 hypothetical protein SAMN05421740_10694 [Parapedobacter koreensis]
MNPGKKNEFDRQLREKFSDFKPEAAADLWDKIAAQLDAQEHGRVVAMATKKRRSPTWWISVAAALLAVCSVVYWFNRPVSVTYLQRPLADAAVAKPAAPTVVEESAAEPPIERLDIARLKRVFARKDKRSDRNIAVRPLDTMTQNSGQPVQNRGDQRLATHKVAPPETPTLEAKRVAAVTLPVEQPEAVEEVLASVPDIQPLVVLEEEEETMLASAEEGKQHFGISNILNYVVGTVDQREEKLVTFSNDGEGSLKLDFNFGLAKNRKKKIR